MENQIPISDEAFFKLFRGIDEERYWLIIKNNGLLIERPDVAQYGSKAAAIQAIAEIKDNENWTMVFAPTIQAIYMSLSIQFKENIQSLQKSAIMNSENLKFLQDRLFYLGTEKQLHPELEKNMAAGKSEFHLLYSNHYDKDRLTANLHFRKSDTADMYFLNRYEATLQKPVEHSKTQTFYLDNGKGITMKEAYNLLDGRAVNKDLKNKEGVSYNAWVKLDFENKDANGNAKLLQYHKNYGYDLNRELARLPIFPMTGEDLKRMVSSLERGNVQEARVHGVEGRQSVYLTANPQFKTMNVFDKDMTPLNKEEKQALYILAEYRRSESYERDQHPGTIRKVENIVHEEVGKKETSPAKEATPDKEVTKEMAVSKSVKPETKPEKVETKGQDQKKTKVSSKKEKVESILPKKRTSQNKGMSI